MSVLERILPRVSVLFTLLSIISVRPALAQNDRIPGAAAGGFLAVFVVIGLGLYIYFALALQTIAQKTNTPNAWFAWIPLVNVVLMLTIAKKPLWWLLLFLIPIVNIVVSVLVWMAVAEARNKPNWWGILTLVPVANLIVPGYLAWSD